MTQLHNGFNFRVATAQFSWKCGQSGQSLLCPLSSQNHFSISCPCFSSRPQQLYCSISLHFVATPTSALIGRSSTYVTTSRMDIAQVLTSRFWFATVCGASPGSLVESLRYLNSKWRAPIWVRASCKMPETGVVFASQNPESVFWIQDELNRFIVTQVLRLISNVIFG